MSDNPYTPPTEPAPRGRTTRRNRAMIIFIIVNLVATIVFWLLVVLAAWPQF